MAIRDPFAIYEVVAGHVDDAVTNDDLKHHFRGLTGIAYRIWDDSPIAATWITGRTEETVPIMGNPRHRASWAIFIEVAAWAATMNAAYEACMDAMDIIEDLLDNDKKFNNQCFTQIGHTSDLRAGPDWKMCVHRVEYAALSDIQRPLGRT